MPFIFSAPSVVRLIFIIFHIFIRARYTLELFLHFYVCYVESAFLINVNSSTVATKNMKS